MSLLLAGIAIGIAVSVLARRFNRYMNDNWSWGPGEFL